jgi:hypothetical protein
MDGRRTLVQVCMGSLIQADHTVRGLRTLLLAVKTPDIDIDVQPHKTFRITTLGRVDPT